MSAPLLGVLIVAVAGIGALAIREARQRRRDAVRIGLLSTFGPAAVAGKADPERLVAWAEVVQTARRLFPDECAELDAAAGGHFPFSPELIEAAHARWTADWLAWERQHDLEYRRRAREVEAMADTQTAGDPDAIRERLAAVTQEKLQTYQDRYEHYVRVGKAIAALEENPAPTSG